MKTNLVWIFVDGVRRYHSEGDDRGRLDIMDGADEERLQQFIDAFKGNDRGGSLEKRDCFPEGS